jgi:hypothetical protein
MFIRDSRGQAHNFSEEIVNSGHRGHKNKLARNHPIRPAPTADKQTLTQTGLSPTQQRALKGKA